MLYSKFLKLKNDENEKKAFKFYGQIENKQHRF
jgi:hypothetical protein